MAVPSQAQFRRNYSRIAKSGVENIDDDLDWAEEDDGLYERLRDEALGTLLASLGRFRNIPPPARELRPIAAVLRKNLKSNEYPFPQVREAAGFGKRPPNDDVELLVASAAAIIEPDYPPLEVMVGESGETLVRKPGEEWAPPQPWTGNNDEDDLPLEFETEGLEFGDWLNIVTTIVSGRPGRWIDPEAIVFAMGLDTEYTEDWIKQGSMLRAIALWDTLGIFDDGRVMTAGIWLLPRAAARAWGGRFDDV